MGADAGAAAACDAFFVVSSAFNPADSVKRSGNKPAGRAAP
jgi:hypothetical protein